MIPQTQYAQHTLPERDHPAVTAALHGIGWRGTMRQLAAAHAEAQRKASREFAQNTQQHKALIKQQHVILEQAKQLAASRAMVARLMKTKITEAKPATQENTKDETIQEAKTA